MSEVTIKRVQPGVSCSAVPTHLPWRLRELVRCYRYEGHAGQHRWVTAEQKEEDQQYERRIMETKRRAFQWKRRRLDLEARDSPEAFYWMERFPG